MFSGKYAMVRPADISRYEEAAVLCKLDYLVLCDGAAGSVCAPWKWSGCLDNSGRLDFVLISTRAHVIWFGKSETTQVLYLCVYGLCESQWRKVSETEQAVFRECIGTNATEWWHIKVGICFFSRTKKLFIHSSLWSSLAVIMSHWSRFKQDFKKPPTTRPHPPTPICQLHSKILTTDAPYPHFDRSLVHLI